MSEAICKICNNTGIKEEYDHHQGCLIEVRCSCKAVVNKSKKVELMVKKHLFRGLTPEDEELIGFIFAMRGNLPEGCKSNKIEYYLIVNELTMPKSIHRGMFRVLEDSLSGV